MPIPDHYVGPLSDDNTDDYVAIAEAATDTATERFFTASDREEVVDLRGLIVELGTTIDLLVPPGRNKALALTALEDVQMRANRGIFAPEGLR